MNDHGFQNKLVQGPGQSCRLALLLLLSLCLPTATSRSFPYLYATADDPNASYPVIDHLSPEHRGLDKDSDNRPAFLYGENNGYRIVEYYIHWCQTCRLFAPVYTKFAQKVVEIAAAQGVEVQVYAINCSPNRKLCLEQKAKDYPKIRLYRPNETEFHHEVGHHLQLHPYSVLDILGITYDPTESNDSGGAWDVESEMAKADASHAAETSWVDRGLSFLGFFGSSNRPSVNYIRSRDDLKADIHLSFDYALRHDVFTSNEALTQAESKVFREWLELMLLAIPSSWGMADLLRELINNFIYVAKSHKYMVAVLNEYPPPNDTWSLSCSKGQPDQGYTCGIWELFHAISVGVVEYNEASFDEEAVKSVEDTARILRDYVDHFFGCITCREHFVGMYDSCELDRCKRLVGNQWRQFPLWLFDVHNAVNVRLAKEGEARRKQQGDWKTAVWPNRQECSLCWDDNGNYDADTVYLFLKHEYGQRNPSTSELRRKLANATASQHYEHNYPRIASLTRLSKLFTSDVNIIVIVLTAMVSWCFGTLVSARRQRKLKRD